jgi:flagellar basal-body rod modification protein FlgD
MTTAIQDLMSATRASNATSATGGAKSAAEIQDRFLTLLVTQLKNQDPLSPMDNAQVPTQLSQISTVSGIDRLNETLTSLSSAMSASQSMLASTAMIGRQVFAPGADLTLANARATGALELAEAADKVLVRIIGPAGDLVRELDLGKQDAGMNGFVWDGTAQGGATAKDGSYTFKVEALRGEKAIEAVPHLLGTVTAVGVSGADPVLVVDGKTEVRFADLRRVE